MRTLLGIVPVVIFLALATHLCFQAGLQPDDRGYVALRVAENFRVPAFIAWGDPAKAASVAS